MSHAHTPLSVRACPAVPVCLPDDLSEDVEQYARNVASFCNGTLTADELKSHRVARGIYEQRHDGTFILRVRVPGGVLSVAQARAVAGISAKHGSGVLHFTTRQNIQFHGLWVNETPEVMRELLPAGLTAKGGGGNTSRNVAACPYAGVCPAERFDVTPYALAVTAHLIRLPAFADLPRKYKIAFSGCSADCALACVTDLGFIAQVRDGVPGFCVYAGGGMGAVSRVGDRIEEWVPAEDVVRIAETVRQLFHRVGDRQNRQRARLRFAVEKMGVEAFRALYRETLPRTTDAGVPLCETQSEPLPAPIAAPDDLRRLLTDVAALTVLRQRQAGWVAVLIPLPFGEIDWRHLDVLAGLAERFSAEKSLRTTQGQNLLLRFVRETDLPELRRELEHVFGLESLRRTPRHVFTACTGAATCRIGLCCSPDAAGACAEALAQAGLDPDAVQVFDIHFSGCPNACGQHPIGTIGFSGAMRTTDEGSRPAYRVLLGARRGEGRTRFGTPVGVVPDHALPAFLVELLRDFSAGRQVTETPANYFDRMGVAYFQTLVARHTSAPDKA